VNEHITIADLLPMYVSGALERWERQRVERHLAECAECKADLELWQAVSSEVVSANRQLAAPPMLAERVLARIHARRKTPSVFRRAVQLLQTQVPLVRQEIWPASLVVMVMGFGVALLSGHAYVVRVLSPLVAAASLAVIYGPEHDPAVELALATPTSPRQILLARLTLVYGYNLLLALTASLGLLVMVPVEMLGQLILGWLGPMTFLSALALVLSLWIGTANAVAIAYGAWLVQIMAGGMLISSEALTSLQVMPLLAAYQQFWNSPLLLLALAAVLASWAVWRAGKQESTLLHWA
jgi:anti-sigma factor RsiW